MQPPMQQQQQQQAQPLVQQPMQRSVQQPMQQPVPQTQPSIVQQQQQPQPALFDKAALLQSAQQQFLQRQFGDSSQDPALSRRVAAWPQQQQARCDMQQPQVRTDQGGPPNHVWQQLQQQAGYSQQQQQPQTQVQDPSQQKQRQYDGASESDSLLDLQLRLQQQLLEKHPRLQHNRPLDMDESAEQAKQKQLLRQQQRSLRLQQQQLRQQQLQLRLQQQQLRKLQAQQLGTVAKCQKDAQQDNDKDDVTEEKAGDDDEALTPETCNQETSLMICNIPCRITQRQLAAVVNSLGFEGKYNFLYAPRARGGSSPCIGYSFINFNSCEDVPGFIRAFTGYQFEGTVSKKRCIVKKARIQGLVGNTDQFPASKLRRKCWNTRTTSDCVQDAADAELVAADDGST